MPTGPFIRKHIFPGAYTPSLSEVSAATERVGLWVADNDACAATTITHSSIGATGLLPTVTRQVAISDERFCRMWEYYLAAMQDPVSRTVPTWCFQLLQHLPNGSIRCRSRATSWWPVPRARDDPGQSHLNREVTLTIAEASGLNAGL